MYNYLKRAGDKHKEIQKLVKTYVKPGIKASEIAEFIEKNIREDPLFMTEVNHGIGFPVGISINDCCAHWTYSQQYADRIIGENDIVKIDFGIHQNGYIIDGAFTTYFNNSKIHQKLCQASQVALLNAIKMFGVDVCLGDVGEVIQETIESFEVEDNGKVYRCKPIFNLSGHKINQYIIHDKKAVPNIKIPYTARVQDNEIYAIEPFVTLDNGNTYEKKDISSHFMTSSGKLKSKKKRTKTQNYIVEKFRGLPFCDKWVDNQIDVPEIGAMVKDGFLKSYPPIYTTNGAPVAQFEKTIGIIDGKRHVFN